MAKFKINSLFSITNRGLVLSGDIVEGEIDSGDLIDMSFVVGELKLKILSIEYIDHLKGIAEIGLMMGTLDNEIQLILKSLNGKTIDILKNI